MRRARWDLPIWLRNMQTKKIDHAMPIEWKLAIAFFVAKKGKGKDDMEEEDVIY